MVLKDKYLRSLSVQYLLALKTKLKQAIDDIDFELERRLIKKKNGHRVLGRP